jgi:16S rRNA (cytosine1402-N4)-methyltransferase
MEGHVSVLLTEAIESLALEPTDTVVDATLGGAGHFEKLLVKLNTHGTLIGIDADADAIARTEAVLAEHDPSVLPTVYLAHDNFRNLSTILEQNGLKSLDKILFDLGWSGYQLTNGSGLSFQADEPLVMNYGGAIPGATAADFVNSAEESEIARVLFEFGGETFSRKIAKEIVESRHNERILTTTQLVAVIERATPSWYHHRKIHPATKTFQALRIYVNDEFGALEEGLSAALEHLAPNGRIAVITFHSSEDRIVKHMFREAADAEKGTLYTKKPMIPSDQELMSNPRSRSAKLRVFIKNA